MRTRWKILIALGIFMALSCGVSFVTMRVQPQNQVEAYKKLLRDQGEKLELSEVLPSPVPAASNSASAVQSAFAMFGSGTEDVPNAMKMVAPGKALVGWAQPDARGYDFTNSWDDFSAHVMFDKPAMEHLHQVLERPKLDFQLDYKTGISLLLPHLAPLKKAVQKLDSATVLALHNGATGEAATNILTMLALVQKDASEGLLISHLVRIAMTSIAVVPTWELLQGTKVTDAQLAAVQNGWEQLDFLGDATNAFVFERAWGINEIQRLRATPGVIGKVFGSASGGSGSSGGAWSWPPDWEAVTETPRYAIGETMWRASWSYSDELQTIKSEQIILETLRTMRTNSNGCFKTNYDAMQTQLSRLGFTNSIRAFFGALKIPNFSELSGDWGLGSAVSKTIRIEAARRVVIAAIALKRFQLKHGAWPKTLNGLTPEFFASVPVDPYNGRPLRYHPNANGTFLLYCVGEDGVDDGGDPSLPASITSTSLHWQNTHARDWVWPQPATPGEIQKYYDEQAKKP